MDEQSWIDIAKDLGVFAVLGTLITILMTQIFSKYFNRQVEEFKSELRHRYYRLERLHEKRSEVVVTLYKHLVKLEDSIYAMTSMIKPGGDDFEEKDQQRIDKTGRAYNQVRTYFKEYEILFPETFCESMNSLIKKSIMILTDYQFYKDFDRRDGDLYKDILKQVKNELPPLKDNLKEELRRIMKVEMKDVVD